MAHIQLPRSSFHEQFFILTNIAQVKGHLSNQQIFFDKQSERWSLYIFVKNSVKESFLEVHVVQSRTEECDLSVRLTDVNDPEAN